MASKRSTWAPQLGGRGGWRGDPVVYSHAEGGRTSRRFVVHQGGERLVARWRSVRHHPTEADHFSIKRFMVRRINEVTEEASGSVQMCSGTQRLARSEIAERRTPRPRSRAMILQR